MEQYIYDAVRTARGKARPDGGLASKKPDELVAELVAALEPRLGTKPAPEAFLLGAVTQVGAQGGHLALVSKFRAGLADDIPALTLNNFCVAGLTAIGQGAAMVAAGQARQVLCGGVEMMSRSGFMADKADYYADSTLPVEKRYLLVALAADRLADDLGIDREALDAAALMSQERALAAEGTALNASRIAVAGLDREECPRPTTAESLAALEPAFGEAAQAYAEVLGREVPARHTVAHAPPMTDGAALAVVGAEGALDAAPRARIVGWVETGGDPAASLTAGFAAMEKVLAKTGLTLDDMDRIEFMEAFAVVIAKFRRDYDPDMSRVNVGGGHLAKGHPLGGSGAILLSTLLDALDACEGRYGLVVATGAAGVGSAMIVERMPA